MTSLLRAEAEQLRRVGRIFADLRADLGELSLTGPRALLCAATALSVVATVAISAAFHMPDLWWAAISSARALMATRPASFRRAELRIAGTAAGAGAAVVLMPFIADDPATYALVLWAVATVGILGFSLSSYGYALLFFGMTFALVTLSTLQDPPAVLTVALLRTLEVGVGCSVAAVVAWTLLPGGGAAETAPGWGDLLGAKFPAVMFAARGGLAVACVPFLWQWLDLPGLVTMPITVVAVMAVPFSATGSVDAQDRAVATKGVLRLIGCVLGGIAGLLILGLSLTSLLPLLLLMAGGIWVCIHVQASTRGTSYVGMQASLVLLMTLVQGTGPPDSILPGIQRLAGILCGLAILTAVTLVLEFVAVPSSARAAT